jgi:dihydropteroate synthase
MGIVNVTPDSFADDGRRFDPAVAIEDAVRMVEDGADIIDIGGESTRPGAPAVDAAEEWRRVAPVVAGARARTEAVISIDTTKAEIASRALDAGADVVNDISALTYDAGMAEVVRSTGAAVVLMHHRGRSSEMYARAEYRDVMGEIVAELSERRDAALEAGIPRDRVVLDPGLGFAKRAEHTWQALAELSRLASLGQPILSGPSRKSFLKAAAGDGPPETRVWATAAAVTASILAGAHIVRVHDVAEMVQVARAADRLVR